MDCTITTTRRNHTSGLTLVELLVAAGLSTMVFASMASLMFFSGRSFVALANYVDLDNSSRSALDRMTTDIRQANKLTSYSATNLVFETTDPSTGATNNLTLNYNEAAGTLTRTYLDQTNTLLNEIKTNSFQFSIFQRNVTPGALSNIITGDASICKGVQLSWTCSRSVLGKSATTESVQSAKIVIRKKQSP